MGNYSAIAELFTHMLYKQLAGIQVATIDDHQFVGAFSSVPNNDSITGLCSISNWQEFNFTIHCWIMLSLF